MKISEIILEAEEPGEKAPITAPAVKQSPSNLPSIHDEPVDDQEDESDDDLTSDLKKIVDNFIKFCSPLGYDLYSFTNIQESGNEDRWKTGELDRFLSEYTEETGNSEPKSWKKSFFDERNIDEGDVSYLIVDKESGIIFLLYATVNGGQLVPSEKGWEDVLSSQSVSKLETLANDADRYADLMDFLGTSKQSRALAARRQLLNGLNSGGQPHVAPLHVRRGFGSEEEMALADREAKEEAKRLAPFRLERIRRRRLEKEKARSGVK